MRALQQLVEDRRRLVDDRVRLTNRITSALKEYFPQVLEWFDDKGTLLFCDFVQRYPSAPAARRARRDTLRRFLAEHNVRIKTKVDERIDAIKSARPLTEDPAVVGPAQLVVKTRIGQLRAVVEGIKEYDRAIAELYEAHPDFAIFDSLPAAGPVFGPRLMAAFGEDRSRFDSPSAVQRYSGTAPVTRRSGKAHVVQWRYRCPTFLRQSFVEWAALTIPRCHWAAVYYGKQRERGNSHNQAVRALAFRWTRVLFRCWQDRTKYSENARLKTLRKARSPLVVATENYAAQS
jgi:transposase